MALEISDDLSHWVPVDADGANVTWELETLPDWRVRHRVVLSGVSAETTAVYARLSLVD